MADLTFLTALIVTFITGIPKVHSYDSEHNRVQNTSQNMTFDNDVLDSIQTQCVEIIGDIFIPMYSSGLCLSIAVCLLAFLIYASIHKKVFRSTAQLNLDNTKHWIHFNFIISFILHDVAILIALLVYAQPTNLAVISLYIYTQIANFYWMHIEGLWLYAGVFFPNSYTKWHYTKTKTCVIGWIVPGIFMMIWGIGEFILSHFNIGDGWMEKGFWGPLSVSCILVPVYFILTTNSVMMIRVLYKVRKMLRESGELRTRLMRRLARATFVLSFLLGLNFAIPLIIFSLHLPAIENNVCAISNIKLINSVISSLQGFFVAVFYVLGNRDVRQFFKTQLQQDFPSLPTPMPSPRVPRRTPSTRQRRDRSSQLSSSSRTPSQSSSTLSPSSAEQSRQTSMTSNGSSLQVPSIRSSQDSRTSKGSSLLDVPSARVSRLSETSETSVTLHVPQNQTRSNSDGYQFLSRSRYDDNDSVFV